MKPAKPLALGIDIGGTNTKVGLVDGSGNIFNFHSFPTQAKGSDPQPFLDKLTVTADDILESCTEDVTGIGVCFHGYIDDEQRGPLICENTPAIRGFDLKSWLGEKYTIPVIVSNDLVSHAMAEYFFGSGRGTRRFMTLAVGTGIGAGMVINGQPLRFLGGASGDTGRIILEPGGPECVYHVSGSAEALCGTANIERLAEKYYGKKVSAYEVIKAAYEGSDSKAVEIIEQIGEYLGWTLASLCTIFLPEKVALTGGTSQAGHVLLNSCRVRFEELLAEYLLIFRETSGGIYGGVEIVLSEYRGESGIVGAVIELLGVNNR